MVAKLTQQRNEYIDLISDEEQQSKKRLDKFVDSFSDQIEQEFKTIITNLVNHVNTYVDSKLRVMSPNFRKNKQMRTSYRSSSVDEDKNEDHEDVCARLFSNTSTPTLSPPRSPIPNKDGSITV